MSTSFALSLAKKYANGGRVQPMTFHGIPISIENKKGTIREGISSDGKSWSNKMAADYGYIKRTLGKDGDQVDVFVGPNKNSNKVFIIDQLHHSKVRFDEHKCLVGFNDRKQALTAYHKSYGRKYGAHHSVGGVTEMSLDAFKEWLKGGGGKKPISPDVPKYQLGGVVEGAKKVGSALYEGVKDWASTPGEIVKQETPELPQTGELTEEDEYLRRAAIAAQQERAAHWGGESALNLYGTSAPFRMPRRATAPTPAVVEPETVDVGRRRVLGGLGAAAAAAAMPKSVTRFFEHPVVESAAGKSAQAIKYLNPMRFAHLPEWEVFTPRTFMSLMARNMGPHFTPASAANILGKYIPDSWSVIAHDSPIPRNAVSDAINDWVATAERMGTPVQALAEKGPKASWSQDILDFKKHLEEIKPELNIGEAAQGGFPDYLAQGEQAYHPPFQEGGAVKYTEPTEEDPTRYPYYESEPGPGTAPSQPVAQEETKSPQPIMYMPQENVTPYPDIGAMPGTQPAPDIEGQPPGILSAIAQHFVEYGKTPGELMKGPEQVQPRVEGQWDEIDEFRQRLAHMEWATKAREFSSETAGLMFGTSAPFVKPGTLGIAGGKPIPKESPPKWSEFDLDPQYVAQDMKQISGSKGTSEGGVFVNPAGEESYIKVNPSFDYARNEVLTSRLYELAGVPAAKSQFTMLNGKPAVASKIIEGKQLSEFHPDQYQQFKNLGEHFPADAWLANWDAVGAGFENPRGNIIIDKDGNAYRIDFGGGLRYSGMGKEKGAKFTPTVDELTKMRDPGKNPSAASVFADVPLDPKNPTANRIANIKDEQIWDLVNQYGPGSSAGRKRLGDTIIARRDDLAKQYGIKKEKPPTSGEPPKSFEEKSLEEKIAEVLAEAKHKKVAEKPKDVPLKAPPKAIAKALMVSFKDSADPAQEITDSIWKIANKHGYKQADTIMKELPRNIREMVDNNLGVKSFYEGHSPWPQMGPDRPQPHIGPEDITPAQTIKVPPLMGLNKKHSLAQILHSIKKKPIDALSPKEITSTQQENIEAMLFKKSFNEIAGAMADAQLTSKQADNILSWFPKDQAKMIDDLYDKMLGGGLQPHELFEKVMTKGLHADKPHWYQQFQKNYNKYYEQLTDFYGLPAKSEAEREADRIAGGFTTPVYSGIRPEHGVMDPFHESSQFHSDMLDVAHAYSVWKNSAVNPKWWDLNPDHVLSEYEHATIQPLWLNTKNYVEVDAGGRSFHEGNDLAWEARKAALAKGKEPDGAVIRNVHDMPSSGPTGEYSHPSGDPFTVYQSWNSATRRSKWARFDPENWEKTGLHLGIAGTMVGGLGLVGANGNGILIDKTQAQEFARGGSVKSTKSEANYRLGTKKEKCAICTMFRPPDSCTAVQGSIRPQDTCDYFELSKRKNPMPLKKGSSQKTISSNIREFHSGDTYAKTKAKFGKSRADKQAIAVAMSTARKYGKKKQSGGEVDSIGMPSLGTKRHGMLHSSIPGRTDKLPLDVPAGAYVLPADIPSALGQGNTLAGDEILGKMFKTGPFGTKIPKIKRAGPRKPRLSLRPRPVSMRLPRLRQEGGEVEEGGEENVPIIAAGGEFIVAPEVVEDIGHGDLKAGHNVLDKFVLQVRKHHIDTLKKLKPPKQ